MMILNIPGREPGLGLGHTQVDIVIEAVMPTAYPEHSWRSEECARRCGKGPSEKWQKVFGRNKDLWSLEEN